MRKSPEEAPSPMVPINMPRPAATRPLMATRPAKIPTIERPKIVIINSSGVRNSKTIGRATKIKTVKKLAPTNPPKSDEAKAADSARAALPFWAIGKPSKTVACDAEEPGMPIKTEAKVSEVGTTATIPIINARPKTGSMPNMKGNKSDRPAMPPRPGKTPMHSPMSTPSTKYPKTIGCRMSAQASPKAGSASMKTSKTISSHFSCENAPPLMGGAFKKKSLVQRNAIFFL